MLNRVMNRLGARELTAEEMDRIAAGTGTGICLATFSTTHREADDATCTDSDSPI